MVTISKFFKAMDDPMTASEAGTTHVFKNCRLRTLRGDDEQDGGYCSVEVSDGRSCVVALKCGKLHNLYGFVKSSTYWMATGVRLLLLKHFPCSAICVPFGRYRTRFPKIRCIQRTGTLPTWPTSVSCRPSRTPLQYRAEIPSKARYVM